MVVRNMRNRDFAETRTPLGVIGGFIGLLAASAAAATLVVAGVTPAIATVGIAASGTIGMFENCLLYTSPSPRDLSTSRMPSSA